jgi:hypothetical protein
MKKNLQTRLSAAFILAGAAALGVTMAAPASANVIQYSLDTFLGSGTPPAGPYGTVTLTDVAGGVSVDVSLMAGNYFVGGSGGAGAALLWDLSGGPTISISGLTSGFTLVSTTAGNIHADGTGYWNYAVECSDTSVCGDGGSAPNFHGPLDFTIASVTTADFVKNGNKYFAASDLCLGLSGGTCTVTGDVAAATILPSTEPEGDVPEPVSIAVLGTGLVALAGFRRRSKAR